MIELLPLPGKKWSTEERKLSLRERKNEGAGARTLDLRIKSPLLYQLSYALGSQLMASCEGIKITNSTKSVKGHFNEKSTMPFIPY